jgi:hypothetical protein
VRDWYRGGAGEAPEGRASRQARTENVAGTFGGSDDNCSILHASVRSTTRVLTLRVLSGKVKTNRTPPLPYEYEIDGRVNRGSKAVSPSVQFEAFLGKTGGRTVTGTMTYRDRG